MSLFFENIVNHGDHLIDLIRDQAEWSRATFGADDVRGPLGPTKHLAKEVLIELLGCSKADTELLLSTVNNDRPPESLRDIKEWADALILLLDGSRRAGHKFLAVIKAAEAKMAENKKRDWPKPDPTNVNDAMEHVRGDDQ